MIQFIWDTSVLSAYSPGRPPVPTAFSAWALANEDRMYVPTIVVSEIATGIEKLRAAGASRRADNLVRWLDELLLRFESRILALDVPTALATGQISATLTAIGRHPGLADVIIAATAKVHGHTVLTRNLKHFNRVGIEVVDPFNGKFPPPPS